MGNALAGAVVNHSGSCAASAKDRISAIGFRPYFCTASSLARIKAEAPSLMVDELAAVAVPSLLNAGRRAGILSNLTFLNSSSNCFQNILV